MAEEKCVAYVSTYTAGDKHGIKIYDVDLENGRFYPMDEVQISNSSYITISHNKKYLYSITDFGVEAYRILEDGGLEIINYAPINGMRGCYVSTDRTDSYLFVAGFHDGKLTVLKLNEDGSIGDITDEKYHKSLGALGDMSYRPHIHCAKITHDNKYLLVTDQGMEHVNVYRFDAEKGTVKLEDMLRSEMESGPRYVNFSKNGKFLYVLHEGKCYIDVYSYEDVDNKPVFEKIQTIGTAVLSPGSKSASSALSFSPDYKYLTTTNAGVNNVVVYRAHQKTGLLEKIIDLPISGDYPKDANLFPGNEFLVSLNHESNDMTFFRVDVEKGTLMMNGPAIHVDEPNCLRFLTLKA
ncbi:MAG: lactonase family protein [Acetatifactor sp.]|nr:lactonase family protein [Acetatifactor sp.]